MSMPRRTADRSLESPRTLCPRCGGLARALTQRRRRGPARAARIARAAARGGPLRQRQPNVLAIRRSLAQMSTACRRPHPGHRRTSALRRRRSGARRVPARTGDCQFEPVNSRQSVALSRSHSTGRSGSASSACPGHPGRMPSGRCARAPRPRARPVAGGAPASRGGPRVVRRGPPPAPRRRRGPRRRAPRRRWWLPRARWRQSSRVGLHLLDGTVERTSPCSACGVLNSTSRGPRRHVPPGGRPWA